MTRLQSWLLSLGALIVLVGVDQRAYAQAPTNLRVLDLNVSGEGTWSGPLAITRAVDYPFVSFNLKMDECVGDYPAVRVQLHLQERRGETITRDFLVREKMCAITSCGSDEVVSLAGNCGISPDWGTPELLPFFADVSDVQPDWRLVVVVDPQSALPPDGGVFEGGFSEYERDDNLGPSDQVVGFYLYDSLPAPFANRVRFGSATGAVATLSGATITMSSTTYGCVSGGTLTYAPGHPWETVTVPYGSLCGNLGELMTDGYELIVNSGNTSSFIIKNGLIAFSAVLQPNGFRPTRVNITLPRGQGLHEFDEATGPSPRGQRIINSNVTVTPRSSPNEVQVPVRYGPSCLTSEASPISICGTSLEISEGKLRYTNGTRTHYRFDLGYQRFDQRANAKAGVWSNDIRFRHSTPSVASDLLGPDGLRFVALTAAGSGQTLFPRGTLAWPETEISVEAGRIERTRRREEDPATTFTFAPTTGCPACGGALGSQSQTVTMEAGTDTIDRDGRLFGKVAAFTPQWGPQKVILPGDGVPADYEGYVFERPDDDAAPAVLNMPGFVMTDTDTGFVDVMQVLLGSVTVDGVDLVLNSIGSEAAQRGNGFFPGVTFGPETYSDADRQPVVGAGQSLDGNVMKIAVGGPGKAWQDVTSSVGTKFFTRSSGYTGSFNFRSVPLSGGGLTIYAPPEGGPGYPFVLSRFAFRTVANETDDYTWLEGGMAVRGKADFEIPFRSLVLQCSGHFSGGVIDRAALRQQRLRAWNAKFDLTEFSFAPIGAQGACSAGPRRLVAGGGVRIEAFDQSLELAATWKPDGTTVGDAKLLGDVSVELDRPTTGTNPDNTARTGFDVELAKARLESKECIDADTPASDACGWFEFDALVGVPFWNALETKLRVTNVVPSANTYKAAPSIVVARNYATNQSNPESPWMSQKLVPNLVDTLKGDHAAKIEATNNWVFDVSLPVRWDFGAGPSEYPRFIADPFDKRSTDLKVLSVRGAADFITAYSTKVSFGAAAKLTELNAPSIALNVDLTDKESVKKIDGFIEGIVPGMDPGTAPVAKAVGFLQNPASAILKATGGGFDDFLKKGLRTVVESEVMTTATDGVARVLGEVQRLPVTLADQVFDSLRTGIDKAISSLLGEALAGPDAFALRLYRDLPAQVMELYQGYQAVRVAAGSSASGAWEQAAGAYNAVRVQFQVFVKGLGGAGIKGLISVLSAAETGVETSIAAVSTARERILILSNQVFDITKTAQVAVTKILEVLDVQNANSPLSVLKCPAPGTTGDGGNPIIGKLNEIEGMVKDLTTALAGKALEKLGSTIGSPFGVDMKVLKTADELFGKVAGALTKQLILGEPNGKKGVIPKVKEILCNPNGTSIIARIKTLTVEIRTMLATIHAQLEYLNELVDVSGGGPKAPRIKLLVLAVQRALDEVLGSPDVPFDVTRITLHGLMKQIGSSKSSLVTLDKFIQQFDVGALDPNNPPIDIAALMPDLDQVFDTNGDGLSDLDEQAIQAQYDLAAEAILSALGFDEAKLGGYKWVYPAANGQPEHSFLSKLPDAIREPVNEFIGVAQNAVGEQITGAMSKLPFPTGKQIREIILQAIMESPFIEQIDKLFHEGMAFLLSEVNRVGVQFLYHVNELIKEVVAKFSEVANQLLAGAVSEIKDALGFSAAGITGYGVLTDNDIERLHLEATFTMNDTKKKTETQPASTQGEQKAETPAEFKASLDAISWTANGKAKGCLPGDQTDGSAPLDIKIAAENLPIKFGPGDGMSIKKLELGFTLDRQNNEIVPIGVFGGFTTAGKMTFKAFELSDIAFVAGIGREETYLGAKARANFQGTSLQVAFLAGRMCSLEVLETLDPMARKFIKVPSESRFMGAYVRGSASFPFINVGCLLQVGANADVGVWVFADDDDNWSVGGLVGGGIYGKAICIVSAKGKITLLGQYANDAFTFLGDGWVAGGIGFCEPEDWNTPADVANDGMCGTACASIQARYEGGSFKIDKPQFSGLD